MDASLLLPLGIAVGLGLLVGLQRERSEGMMAGVRTFPLFTLFGVITGAVGAEQGGWIPAAGLLAVGGLLVTANVVHIRGEDEPDITLSTAQLVRAGRLDVDTAWRAILIGGMSNLLFKGGVVAVLGGKALRGPVFKGFGVALAVGVAIFVLG